MSRSQQYISSIFEHLPKASLPEAGQQTFDQIRNKLEASADVMEELKMLFKVRNMSDVALSLLWIAEKVENDPSRLDPTTDEEALVFSMLKGALSGGEMGQPPPAEMEAPPLAAMPEVPAEQAETPAATFDFPSAETLAPSPFETVPTAEAPSEPVTESAPPVETTSVFDVFNTPPAEEPSVPVDSGVGAEAPPAEAPPAESSSLEGFGFPTPETAAEPPAIPEASFETPPSQELASTPEPPAEVPPSPEPMPTAPSESTPAVTVGVGNEVEHAALFEKFIEALQNAADDRMALFDQLIQVSTGVVSGEGAQDYKDYSQLLIDLLKSFNDNQMLDDIRAMNMLSTAFDPFSQWAKADATGREGLLFQGIEALKGFKALFE